MGSGQGEPAGTLCAGLTLLLVPLSELWGWEEPEGGSTSNTRTSSRSGTAAPCFLWGLRRALARGWGHACSASPVPTGCAILEHTFLRAGALAGSGHFLNAGKCCWGSDFTWSRGRMGPCPRAGRPLPGTPVVRGRRHRDSDCTQGSHQHSARACALLQYAADPEDKHWLAEHQHMRATGGKMVSSASPAPAACGRWGGRDTRRAESKGSCRGPGWAVAPSKQCLTGPRGWPRAATAQAWDFPEGEGQ